MLPRTSRWSPPPADGRATSVSRMTARRPSRTPSPTPAPLKAAVSTSSGTATAGAAASSGRPFGADLTNAQTRSLTPPAKMARAEAGRPGESSRVPADRYVFPAPSAFTAEAPLCQPYLCRPAVSVDEALPRDLESAALHVDRVHASKTGHRGGRYSLDSVSPITALQDEELEVLSWCTPGRVDPEPGTRDVAYLDETSDAVPWLFGIDDHETIEDLRYQPSL